MAAEVPQEFKVECAADEAAENAPAAANSNSSGPYSCVTGTTMVVRNHMCNVGEEKVPFIMGIDEAGRGPVLGPMVYAGMFAPASVDLTNRSFADSKTLTAEKRDALFDGEKGIESDDKLGYAAELLSAHFISENMLGREKVSLNVLAMNSTIKIIRTVLDMGVYLTEVFVDTVGDPGRHEAQLSRRFPTIKFTVCPKADALYPCVSGASIVAKVIRDRALEVCKLDCGLSGELGCGYPGDSVTQAFLQANKDAVFGFPPIVRHSWETCNRMMAENGGVSMSWEVDEEQDGGADAAQQQRLSFKSASSSSLVESSAAGRHPYFRARKMQRLTEAF